MKARWFVVGAVALALLGGSTAGAAQWSGSYVRQLPDSAFAAVEKTPDGKILRHLPHHNAQGNLDVPHLCSALARIRQVKWQEPKNAEPAERHLRAHLAEVGPGACRPAPRTSP
jgi:hypothetical protein